MAVSLSLSCMIIQPKEVNWKHSHSSLKLSFPRVGFFFSRPNFLLLPSASSRSTESSMASEDTAISLDRVQVFDLNGKGIVISDLWKERKAVVAFARHFGCILCRKRADYLGAKKDVMDAAGVALILIGPGSVDQDLTKPG